MPVRPGVALRARRRSSSWWRVAVPWDLVVSVVGGTMAT